MTYAISVNGARTSTTDNTGSLVEDDFELIDPTPDVRALFVQYDRRFFDGKLVAVEVKWSPRMTMCAGLCCYEGRNGLCSIRLSQPLLKLRPRKDLVQTLLHEMIHAFLFLTANNKDHDAHGPEFQRHMHRINAIAGTSITIYHTFHAEVALHQRHWWRCDGACRSRKPYFGYVKRAMNRAPGPNDTWHDEHKRNCGGNFVKVKEPEGFADKKKRKTKSSVAEQSTSNGPPTSAFPGQGNMLGGTRPVVAGTPKDVRPRKRPIPSPARPSSNQSSIEDYLNAMVPKVKRRVNGTDIGSMLPGTSKAASTSSVTSNETGSGTVDLTSPVLSNDLQPSVSDAFEIYPGPSSLSAVVELVNCPVCQFEVGFSELNEHLDVCLVVG